MTLWRLTRGSEPEFAVEEESRHGPSGASSSGRRGRAAEAQFDCGGRLHRRDGIIRLERRRVAAVMAR